MKKWLKRIRGAVGMGLTWAVAWFGASVIFTLTFPGIGGVLSTIPTLGFIGGAAFSVVLGIAGRRRRFDEMSLPRFAGWGGGGWSFHIGDIHRDQCSDLWCWLVESPPPGDDLGQHLDTTGCGLRRWFAGTGQNGRRPRVA